MAGRYGMTQAAKLIGEGLYEEAIVEATRRHLRDDEDPEPLIERAEAQALLYRFGEAVGDLEQAITVGREAELLDVDLVDDAYFSALVGAAKKDAETSVPEGVDRLGRYARFIPEGRHLQDALDWIRRLRGELKTEIIRKER